MTRTSGSDSTAIADRPRTRSRRAWAAAATAALLLPGLVLEFVRFGHRFDGRLTTVVVIGVLAVGIAAALADPGRSRVVRAVASVALAAGVLLAVANLRAPTDPLVGDWTATGTGMAATTVAITRSVSGYTVMTKVPARFPGSRCELPAGTVLAAFGTTDSGRHGQQLLLNPADCRWSGWEELEVSLDSANTTIREKVPSGHDLVLTKIV